MVLQSSGTPISFSQIISEYKLTANSTFSIGANGRGLDNRVPQTGVISMSSFYGKNYYPTSQLQLWLDTRWTQSYSGTGTAWNDMSGKGNNFTLSGTYSYDSTNKKLVIGNYSGGNKCLATGPASDKIIDPSATNNTDHTVEIICNPTVVTANIFIWFMDSGNSFRMINAHIPWSNSNIYYDVRSCCDPVNRIDYNDSSPPRYITLGISYKNRNYTQQTNI